MRLYSIMFVSHQYSNFKYRWWTICLIVVTRIVLPYSLVFLCVRIEDDIEWDNEDDDAEAIIVITALTASCIVMKEHIYKKKQRQKKKKGGHPFTISRQRMYILVIRRLMSDPYFKQSYHFSHTEIKNLIQCIGPHFVISMNEKKQHRMASFLWRQNSLYQFASLQVVVHTISFHCSVWDTLHFSDVFGRLLMPLRKHQTWESNFPLTT